MNAGGQRRPGLGEETSQGTELRGREFSFIQELQNTRCQKSIEAVPSDICILVESCLYIFMNESFRNTNASGGSLDSIAIRHVW